MLNASGYYTALDLNINKILQGMETFTISVGKINPLPCGYTLVVLPGSTVSINWTFTDDPAKSILEWYFKPGDGSSQQRSCCKISWWES